jgi:hydroxylamine reductase (hybrid-cluster protein)
MSNDAPNNTSKNDDADKNTKKALQSLESDANEALENEAITGVEVLKGDKVTYKEGDFEDDESDNDHKSAKNDKPDQDHQADEDDSSKAEQSDQDTDSNESDDSDKKQHSDKEDKSGLTMAGIYQWASKLKDDFKSEAADITHEVTEKAAAMTLGKLLDAVDMELAAFDKSIEVAKELVANAEEERERIASKKDKYQGMIDKLDQ